MSQISLTVEERQFYSSIFNHFQRDQCIEFTSLQSILIDTTLSKENCSKLWQLSKQLAQTSNQKSLNQKDFYIILRFIACIQVDKEPTMDNIQLNLPLPTFKSFNNTDHDLTSSTTNTIKRISLISNINNNDYEDDDISWSMTNDEKKWYEGQFIKQTNNEKYLEGSKAIEFLRLSKLADETLKEIWQLSDVDNDGKLSLAEFCIAMHIIRTVKHRNVLIPKELPHELLKIITPNITSHLKKRSISSSSTSGSFSIKSMEANTLMTISKNVRNSIINNRIKQQHNITTGDHERDHELNHILSQGLSLFDNDLNLFIRQLISFSSNDELYTLKLHNEINNPNIKSNMLVKITYTN